MGNNVMSSLLQMLLCIRGHGLFQPASPPCVRGCRAFSVLLMQLERDRHQKVQLMGEHKAVSKFLHRLSVRYHHLLYVIGYSIL